jgi:hypothetical protein
LNSVCESLHLGKLKVPGSGNLGEGHGLSVLEDGQQRCTVVACRWGPASAISSGATAHVALPAASSALKHQIQILKSGPGEHARLSSTSELLRKAQRSSPLYR